jgi:hypothetical protein
MDGLGWEYPAGVTGNESVFQNDREVICPECYTGMNWVKEMNAWICPSCKEILEDL